MNPERKKLVFSLAGAGPRGHLLARRQLRYGSYRLCDGEYTCLYLDSVGELVDAVLGVFGGRLVAVTPETEPCEELRNLPVFSSVSGPMREPRTGGARYECWALTPKD